MQNTRLTQLLSNAGQQVEDWLSNSWRQLSLLTISLLLGYFVAGAVASIAGQAARWDTTVALVMVILVELLNRWVYGGPRDDRRSFWRSFANNFKIGVIYSLCLEALKLGS